MPYAISYKRFSTARQASGDSNRRQTDLAEEYCRRNALKLIDTYLDAGVSGFTGEHLSDNGALRILLDQAQAGQFPSGTCLIVESLDRLSRLEMSTALRLFLDILDSGLVIVTLIDGEQVFTRERVDGDPTALMFAILILSRANNQSRLNKERSLEAWRTARRRAREHKIPVSKLCPFWLEVVGNRRARRFVIIEERAQVIRLIFELAVSGMGHEIIMKFLNTHNVPTFTGALKWRRGVVSHLLGNRAVLGIFEPTLGSITDGRRTRIADPEGPIEDYYPAIVSYELYNQYKTAAASRRLCLWAYIRRPYRNLILRLGRCALCGDALHLTTNVGHDYLRCASARQSQCTNKWSYPYHSLEPLLLVFDDITEIVSRLVPKKKGESLRIREVSQLKATIARAKARLAEVPTASGQPVSPQLARQRGRIARLEDKLLDAERNAFRADLFNPNGRFARFRAAKAKAQSPDDLERQSGREALAVELRRVIDGVVLHDHRRLTIHTRPDVAGYRIVYSLNPDGLVGIQVNSHDGVSGFIGPSLFRGFMRSVRPTRRGRPSATDEPLWQSVDIDELLKRVHVISLPNGRWEAVVSEPPQIEEIVRRGEHALTFRTQLLKSRFSTEPSELDEHLSGYSQA